MKSTVEHVNPTRVKLNVEVPFDELKPHFDKAYKTLSSQVRVPGFRPGKVPAKIIDARVGRGTILSEVVNEAIPQMYGQAVSENSLTPLGQPEIEVTEIEDGQTLAFTAEVDIRPEITVPGRELHLRRGRRRGRRGLRRRHRDRGPARPVRHRDPASSGPPPTAT